MVRSYSAKVCTVLSHPWPLPQPAPHSLNPRPLTSHSPPASLVYTFLEITCQNKETHSCCPYTVQCCYRHPAQYCILQQHWPFRLFSNCSIYGKEKLLNILYIAVHNPHISIYIFFCDEQSRKPWKSSDQWKNKFVLRLILHTVRISLKQWLRL